MGVVIVGSSGEILTVSDFTKTPWTEDELIF